jgi:DNA-binding Xre family transcriptional regulator
MAAMPIKWKVKEYLQAHNITPYRFWKESGLANRTAYRLVNGKTHNLNTETLDAALKALRSLTGKPVSVADLLEYEEKGR